MSVIVGRALPDVRDGLKPVHRRILFAMHGLSLSPSAPHRKCARVVGEVLGKYHPHGDTAVYDALVRLAQPFSMRSPLVDGHGNFGSLDADPPAAMRYTECRLRPLSAEVLLKDLGAEGTVAMAPNFDGSVEEPTVLPARVPLLLVNGSSGIAVGIATRIPPHNLREVVAAMTLLVRNPETTTAELMRVLPAPDFPTGGEILDAGGVAAAYESGRGPVTVRGKVDIEVDGDGGKKATKKTSRRGRRKGSVPAAAALSSADSDTEELVGSAAAASSSPAVIDDASLDGSGSGGKTRIVISELPYQTNKAAFVTRVAELVDEGSLTGIADVRDESDRSGTRVVVELRRGTPARVVLGQLYRQTPLQARFSCNMVALVNGTPRTLSLREMLLRFIEFRSSVVRRRARFELGRAQAREHVVRGLLVAMASMDAVVAAVRSAPDASAAQRSLMSDPFNLSEAQADAVLAMALRRLTSLEKDKLERESAELLAKIADLESLLASPARVADTLVEEAAEVAAKFGDDRRTTLRLGDDGSVDDEALVPDGESIVVFSKRGFVKRMPADTFAQQGRGTRGKLGATPRGEGDGVGDVLAAGNRDTLLFFTRDGGVFSLRVHAIPEASRGAAGTAIPKLISVDRGDGFAAMLAVRDFGVGGGSSDGAQQQENLLLLTRNGLVKRTALDQFAKVRRNGMAAIGLREGTGDELTWVARAPAGSRVLVAASNGSALLFATDSLRPSSRSSTGVAAMRLAPGAKLVGMCVLPPPPGYVPKKVDHASTSSSSDDDDDGNESDGGGGEEELDGASAAGAASASADDDDGSSVLFVTKKGMGKRVPLSAFRVMRRNCGGVRAIKLADGDELAALLPVPGPAGESNSSSSSLSFGSRGDLLVGTASGVMLRLAQTDIPASSRSAKGVRVVRLGEGDTVSNVTAMSAEDEEGGEGGGGGGASGSGAGRSRGGNGVAAASSSSSSSPPSKKTAYMMFCDTHRADVRAELGGNSIKMTEVAKELGRRWKALDEGEKAKYKA